MCYTAVSGGVFSTNNTIPKGDTTPIVLVIPGLTSDSDAAVSFIFNFCVFFFTHLCSVFAF